MSSRTLFCLYAVVIAVQSEDVRDSKIVNILQGPVRGYKDLHNDIFSFKGIPYATAPTGTHRFKAPLPPPVWTQPLEAIDRDTIVCPQILSPIVDKNKMMQENCLIVNVHIPDTENKILPVVVYIYIHGGGFQIGYGDMLIPKKLIVEHNIIAVTLNYRLGVHGFLSLGTDDIPGNGGMKDIVAALRWVKKNIASFGGDPDNVTIAGYSAGAAAVNLLMLSKSAEGLFHKAVPESGASIGAWTIQPDPIENAQKYAKRLNFTNVDDIFALEDFYKSNSYELLNSVVDLARKDSLFGFSPCVERAMGEEVFLDASPVEILKSGKYRKLPLLYGFTNMEGLMRINMFDSWKNEMNEKFSDFLPVDLEFVSGDQKEIVAKQIKQFYFGDKPVSEENVIGYIDFFTDVLFAYPSLRAVKYHVEAGHDKIYLYEYSYVDENNPFVPYTNVKGADHGSQIVAVFNGIPGLADASNFTEQFRKFAVVMRELWGNFIKNDTPVVDGSPVDAWPPVGAGWSPHMSIGTELRLRRSLLENRMRLWDDIYSRYYRDPVPPTTPHVAHNEL